MKLGGDALGHLKSQAAAWNSVVTVGLRPGVSACVIKHSFKGGDEYKFCWCLLTGRELQRAAAGMLLEGSADGRPELPGGSHGSREAQKEDPRFHSEELPILFPMSSPEIDPTEASNLGEPWPP
ncbi:unnamed protein product [Symbiodinium sp. KB8]|nr:unnamed protein product [Symbiodinium sp. KB8]